MLCILRSLSYFIGLLLLRCDIATSFFSSMIVTFCCRSFKLTFFVLKCSLLYYELPRSETISLPIRPVIFIASLVKNMLSRNSAVEGSGSVNSLHDSPSLMVLSALLEHLETRSRSAYSALIFCNSPITISFMFLWCILFQKVLI